MSDFRRFFVPGGTYFFTLVTYDRRQILTTKEGRTRLHHSIVDVRNQWPFRLFANVLLPDHWHCILMLPSGDAEYSKRVCKIKNDFTRRWLEDGLPEATVTKSQKRRGERGIWQPRFWEHTVRDEDDLKSCVDYIHWNPRKHGLVGQVKDWPWSSFHRFVDEGEYEADWGGNAPDCMKTARDWGE
ncbi:Transposase IS200 like protein [Rubripirellula obstinata]|uniref:Transposase IS200 like protein n=1 Tax=Rubripirellula obstinata TaxID=406547 RepID=A0A5B1CGA5_9BACT|nr:transposase [Rubripirellula obstinata]KAA1260218.1 Transposase IS200 like protein [Rubripirellula obstinata]